MKIYEFKDVEPEPAAQVLDWIGTLCRIESRIRAQSLTGKTTLKLRQDQANLIATKFFPGSRSCSMSMDSYQASNF